MPVEIRSLLRAAHERLAAAGVPDPEIDAELIVAHHLEVSRGRVQALAVMGERLGDEQAHAVSEMVAQRAERVPLQHLTGRAPFRSMQLRVGPGVFVPRPETEGVVQFAIDVLEASPLPEPVAVDLGAGSGAIALAMATEVPRARVFAVEKSPEARVWTEQNIAEQRAENLTLLAGELQELLPGGAGPVTEALAPYAGKLQVLISNPPYVPDAAVPRDPEVRLHDPKLALYGGKDGLDIIRDISRIGLGFVAPGGLLVLEHGELQGAAIRELLTADGWRAAATHPDLTTRDRTTTAIR